MLSLLGILKQAWNSVIMRHTCLAKSSLLGTSILVLLMLCIVVMIVLGAMSLVRGWSYEGCRSIIKHLPLGGDNPANNFFPSMNGSTTQCLSLKLWLSLHIHTTYTYTTGTLTLIILKSMHHDKHGTLVPLRKLVFECVLLVCMYCIWCCINTMQCH